MGLGTTKKKLRTYTAIQRMIEDDFIVSSSKAAILKYIIQSGNSSSFSINSKSLPDYLVEASQNTLQAKFDKAYRYAASGNYAYGLPTANNISNQTTDIKPVIKSYLEGIFGNTVTIDYALFGSPNYHHFMWTKLLSSYGYNPNTNEVTTLSTSIGFPCYLKTAKVYYGMATITADETGDSLKQYGVSTESGECLTRAEDLNRALVTPSVDTNVQDAYVVATVEYIEVIPDTTAPSAAVINEVTTTYVTGYAEKLSTVKVYINGTFHIDTSADAQGYFYQTFSSAITAGDIVSLVVKDSANNISTVSTETAPYTNPSPATVGTNPTVTHVTKSHTFTFDFLDTIGSDIEIPVADPDDPPTVVVNDSYVPEYDYIQARYSVDYGSFIFYYYFTYAYGTGGIATLDNMFISSSASGEFYPRLYARLGSQNLPNTLSTTSNEYKSSTRLAKTLGLVWKDWAKTLHDSITDVHDVTQLFITLAVPMNTTDSVVREYLYRYWLKMHGELTTVVTDVNLSSINGKQGTTIEVKDSAYTHYVRFSAITSHLEVGSIGAVGTYSSEYLNSFQSSISTGYIGGTGSTPYTNTMTALGYPSYHAYRYQIDTNTYREIRVYSASSVHLFAGASTSAVGTDSNLIIPLDRTATLYLTGKEKEVLYAKSFYLFVNMAKIIKVKWYARAGFKILMNVIAVVIAVVTVGAGAPISAYLLAIGQAILINTAISLVFNALVRLGISKELSAVLVVVAALYAQGFDITSLEGIASMTAVQMLYATSLAFDMTTKVASISMMELQKEAETFYADNQEKQASLQQAKELLNNSTMGMDLELLISPSKSRVFITLGESVDTYMAKPFINIVALGQSLVENYVEISMQPPNLSQLIQQSQRGYDNEFSI